MSTLRQKHRESRQKRILAAARQAFCESGYDQAKIEDIARCAEVSSVTVFNYYRSKGSVLLAVVAESDRQLVKKLDAVLDEPPADPIDAIIAFSHTTFEHGFSTLAPDVWRHVVATAITEGSSEFGRGYRELDRELARRLARLVEVLIRRGDLKPDLDPGATGEILYTIYNARFQEFAADPAMTREAAEDLVRRDLTLVVDLMRQTQN